MANPVRPEGESRCTTCGIVFSFPGARELHWEFSQCRFKCSLCADGLSHGSDRALNDHWKRHHEQFFCSRCQKIILGGLKLRRHDCKKSHKCKRCHADFSSRAALGDHYRAGHGLTYCRGCHKYYLDVDGERMRHKTRCFVKSHGPEASESEEEANGGTEGKGFKEQSKEKPKSDKKDEPEHAKERPKRFCRGCHKYYRDVDGESKRHKRRCFAKGYGSEGSQSEDETKEAKGLKEQGKEKPKSNKEGPEQAKEKAKSNKKEQESNGHSKSTGEEPSGKVHDLYGLLKLHPSSSQEEIAQAARKRRIEVHPDKLKKPGMTDVELRKVDETAMEVGFAADILLDPKKRAKYDRERRERKQHRAMRRWENSRAE
ncbi:MAG: hypothetical protein L6R39_007537 [Caloplaca ligustica]|nr:MAG: hypothetical protein L6R39_007537 [Caloplaca ligustica]